jgi:hypothetical protein
VPGIPVDTPRTAFMVDGKRVCVKTISNPEDFRLWVAIRSLLLLQDRAGLERREPALLHLNFWRAGCYPICSFWKNGSLNGWTPEPYSSSKTRASLGMRKTPMWQ